MNTPATIAVALAAAWLGILTLVVVLLVRQIGLLTVRLEFAGTVGDDGPDVGSLVPESVAKALPQLERSVLYLLFVSPTCGPCVELVPRLGREGLDGQLVALFAGADQMADDFAAMFPRTVQLVRDPQASVIAEALRVRSSPFALEVDDGIVTGRRICRTRPTSSD